ncbi:MAG: LysM peptidoglycan-binding domain-containing protein [Bacteroidetes bacterium]|nr:LysM peptidoglycan-binding domain-containing protein [Bacteroidota bacterium]
MFVAINVSAQIDSLEVHQINGKSYYIHIVESGNTLYAIHKKYNVPIDVIEKENPSVADGLSLGEKIFIPIKKDTEAEFQSIDGNYFLHKVEKGRTLYSLAKEFNLQQKDIITLNPEIDEIGIKEGQLIKIPVKEIRQTKPVEVEIPTGNYKTHLVKVGETLYSLSKSYHVSIDSIKLVNNGLDEGLKEGQTIFLPIKQGRLASQNIVQTSLVTTTVVDTIKQILQPNMYSGKKSVYKIALMLSFYLEENQEMTQSALEKRKVYPKSIFAIEFYQGVLLALDSLSTDDVKFELFVYDTKGQDSSQTVKILSKPELKSVDLIIGPLYASNFERAAVFAKKNNIPIISPVKQNNKVLLGNEYVFKVVPSKISSLNQIVKLVIDSFSTDNLLVVQSQNITDNTLVDGYIKGYNAAVLGKNDTSRYSPIKKVVVTRSDEIVSHLKLNANNVIFIPTKSSTFVTNLFISLTSKLNSKEYNNCTITLIGLEEWLQFESIDIEYFQTLNVHLTVNNFVDFENPTTKQLTEKYYNKFETYPSTNSFLGYDVVSYFMLNLIKTGNAYQPNLSSKLVSTDFNFFKTGIESGYENTSIRLLKFDNYTLRMVY